MTRKFILLLFISILLNINLSANAEAMFSGQANLNSIENGTITSTANTCQVNVNAGAAGATVNWETLNVPQNNTLNFYFHDANQYALNKVSTGLTNIAGNVGYAEGSKAGTVILSNPNGINIAGTANINLGSLFLTTHDVQIENNMAKLNKALGKDNQYHGITIQDGAKLKLDNNLTITSIGNIDITGANISSGNNITFLTADGLNYIATSNTISNIQNASETTSNAISIATSSLKTNDGKIVLTSTSQEGNIQLVQNEIYSDINITSKNEVTFDGKYFSYAWWGGYYLPNYIQGNTIVNATNVNLNNMATFNGITNFLNLEKISSQKHGLFYNDINILTKSEDMANSISEVFDEQIYYYGALNIDIMPEPTPIVIEPTPIATVIEEENTQSVKNVTNDADILANYDTVLEVQAQNPPNTNLENAITLKALASDDLETYKDEFLKVSVYENKQGNLYTTDTFKGE